MNISQKYIFFDLDGVLVDLYQGIIDNFSLNISTNNLLSRGQIWDELSKKTNLSRSKSSNLVHELGDDFWKNLPKTPIADELIESIEALEENGHQVFVLTATARNSKSCAGKATWVKKNLPKKLRKENRIIFTYQKWVCAQPGRFLIDDKNQNLEEWNGSGGTAIKCHQPWNCPTWEPSKALTCKKILDIIEAC